MSDKLLRVAQAGQPRRTRRIVMSVATVVVVAAVALVTWVASPASDWYLPGQSATLRTAVDNSVNGHSVIVTVSADGDKATIAVDDMSDPQDVTVGGRVDLGRMGNMTVTSISGGESDSSDSNEVGGTGTVVARFSL